MWGGHACPPLLFLISGSPMNLYESQVHSKSTSTAADKSVRPAHVC